MTAIQFQVKFVNEWSTNKFGTSSIYNRKQYPYVSILISFFGHILKHQYILKRRNTKLLRPL